MLATQRFSDVIGTVDCGMISASFSASTTINSGSVMDLSKFQKFIFMMQCTGIQYGNKTLQLYSCSTSASSISSASSNWAAVDSANLSLVMSSSAMSVSSNRYLGILEVRAEKVMNQCSTSSANPVRWVRPVITCTSGVSSTSVDTVTLQAFGALPAYGFASSQTGTAAGVEAFGVVVEVDYL